MRPPAYLHRTELMTPDTEKLDVSTGVGASPRCRGLVTCVLHNEVICSLAMSKTESCSDGVIDTKVKNLIFVTTVDSDGR